MDSDGFNSMPDELKFIHLSSLGDVLLSSLPKAQPQERHQPAIPTSLSLYTLGHGTEVVKRGCKED